MALIWSARAKRDLKDIGTYIARDNRRAAVAMVKRIVAAATSLNVFPAMGHPGRVPDTRELLVPGMPYIVVYRMRDRTVRIIAVMHTSREWPGDQNLRRRAHPDMCRPLYPRSGSSGVTGS